MIRAAIVVVISLLAACGGGGPSGFFAPTFPDNRPEDVEQVMARMRAAPPAEEPAVAVGLADGVVFAWDLAGGRLLWQQPSDSRTAPQVAGDLVVTQETNGVMARELRTGAERFRTDDEAMHLIGADGEGNLGAIVLSTGGGVGAHSRLIVTRAGDIDWDAEVDYALGKPAVRAGMVFLPWSNQNVSVVDAGSGRELARLRVADDVVAEAFSAGGDVYAGQSGVFRITPSLVSGTRERAAHFTPSVGEMPGRPSFMRNAYQPPPSPQSALHRIRLEWYPAGSGEELSLADGNLYVVYYKLVFALDPNGEGVRWVHEHPADVVGAAARPGGLWLADARGGIAFVGAEDGRVRPAGELGVQPVVVSLRASGEPPAGAPEGEVLPLRDQLLAAAQSTDARLVPARELAIQYLAGLDDPEVTTNLIALCEARQLPAPVRASACTKLGERTDGGDQVMRALERHAAFLEGTTTPPVGALARAVMRMEDRRAVPLLISHLRDPGTPVEDLAAVLSAIEALGDRSAADPVRDFVRLYHAESPDDHLAAALGVALEALVELEGPVARETLEEIGADPLGIPGVRAKARALVTALEEQTRQAEQAAQEGDETPEAAEAPAGEADEPGQELPERINAEIVRQVLAPVDRELRQCLMQADGRPRSARLILRLDGDGNIERISITPEQVVSCVEALVRAQSFPANRRHTSQQVVFTLRR